MKKILMLLQKEFPPDIRVEKEARALQKAGFEIHLLCRNRHGKRDEVVHGIFVDRLKPIYRSPLLRAAANYPLFANPFWLRQAASIVAREKIDFLHAHDLPMAPLALAVSRGRIPVIYDMHENYPAAMEIWSHKRPISRLFRTHRLAARLDRFCCRHADHILVVVEEQQERLVTQGLPAERITVVGNRVDTESFLSLPVRPEILSCYRDGFVILYAGSFSADRGLEVPIRAMRRLREKIEGVRLVLVGDGPNRDELQALAKKEGVAGSVEFVGWQPFENIPSFIRAARVCIVPQPGNAFIDTTIPHKLFQYMALRRPVVVSDARPLARWVRRMQAGEVFASGDYYAFADCVLRIYHKTVSYYPMNDEELLEAVDWRHDAANLVATYLQLSSRKKQR